MTFEEQFPDIVRLRKITEDARAKKIEDFKTKGFSDFIVKCEKLAMEGKGSCFAAKGIMEEPMLEILDDHGFDYNEEYDGDDNVIGWTISWTED